MGVVRVHGECVVECGGEGTLYVLRVGKLRVCGECGGVGNHS